MLYENKYIIYVHTCTVNSGQYISNNRFKCENDQWKYYYSLKIKLVADCKNQIISNWFWWIVKVVAQKHPNKCIPHFELAI